jgi:hypothetical protein
VEYVVTACLFTASTRIIPDTFKMCSRQVSQTVPATAPQAERKTGQPNGTSGWFSVQDARFDCLELQGSS